MKVSVDLNAIWKDEQLKGNEQHIFIYLASHYNIKYGYAFPKRETIQSETGISIKTLNKILNSLEEKGYITRANTPNKGGRNNIYYIHKYLVIQNNNENAPEPQRELSDDNASDNSNDNIKSNTEPYREPTEKSVNEMLLDKSEKFDKKLTSDQRELLNRLDTDRLMKAIADAETSGKYKTYNFAYLIGAYKKLDEAPGDKAPKVVTKYHNSFNEHYKKYPKDEFEAKLLKMQGVMSFAK